MKKFKTVDYWISIVLIITTVIAALANPQNYLSIGYFVVGGWQVISMLTHAIKGWFVKKKGTRYLYHWVVAVFGGFWLIMLTDFKNAWPLLYLPLLVTPVMAVGYTALCINEVHIKLRRPLDLLK